MAEATHDPNNYRAMSEPFESQEAAKAAASAFYEDVRAARQKHRIADVYTIIAVTFGDSQCFISAHLGSELMAEGMTAYAFGYEKARSEERIGNILTRSAMRE